MCVYDQTYALEIVTQLKKEKCAIRLDKKTQFLFSFKFTKPFLSWSKQLMEN